MTKLGVTVLLAALVLPACIGDLGGGQSGGDTGPASLELVSPAPGAELTRDTRGSLGELVAPVALAARAGGPIVRVAFVADDALDLGEAMRPVGADDLALDSDLDVIGPHTITAIGYDADGAELARADVDVTVVEPDVADCYGWLDLYGLDYTRGPNNQGVTEPVTVTVPINGMSFRYSANDTPREKFFMDCTLARSLAQAAPMLRARDVIQVVDIGVYNYRCIGGTGTPPDCPRGISQHAYAKAIDIAGFLTGDGTFYSVLDDWVIDPSTEKTCEAGTDNDKDAFLHQTICELKHANVWNIVLTPNYNADHRNHFHVDLTDGADFIRDGDDVDVGPDLH